MPTPGTVAGAREPAAWEDPARRVLASLRAAGVAFAERRLPAGEPIYGEGDPDGGLYFVLSGSARVYKRYGRGGLKEATVALVGGGGVFGEPALEVARPHRDNAEATPGGCRLATVRKATLARHVARDASCGLALLLAYWGWAQRREAAIARLLPRGVRPRLANLLLELDAGPGLEVGAERLTQERLAQMVACCREAVSPELASLRREGVLGVGKRGGVVVLDRAALARAALPAFTRMRARTPSELRA
jgi:CRP/FNR family transcriptional regulator, cyclic AMP receptor protein